MSKIKDISNKITDARQRVQGLIDERDREIKREAVTGDKSYADIGEEAGISSSRVDQILKDGGISVAMKDGLKKKKVWGKRISEAKTKKENE